MNLNKFLTTASLTLFLVPVIAVSETCITTVPGFREHVASCEGRPNSDDYSRFLKMLDCSAPYPRKKAYGQCVNKCSDTDPNPCIWWEGKCCDGKASVVTEQSKPEGF